MDFQIDIRTNIARNIRKYRDAKGLTQEQLGDILGKKKTTVSTWELGTSLPDAETLFYICQILCVSLSDVYGGEPTPRDSKPLSRVEVELVDAYRATTEGRREAVRALLDIEGKGVKSSAS